jgi:hypothetical protein
MLTTIGIGVLAFMIGTVVGRELERMARARREEMMAKMDVDHVNIRR